VRSKSYLLFIYFQSLLTMLVGAFLWKMIFFISNKIESIYLIYLG
jgi:hypothetical protein